MKRGVLGAPSGYEGNVKDWERFLFCWEREVQERLRGPVEDQTNEQVAALRRTPIRSSPAGREEISKIESKLKTSLPQSYKDFLMASNGWAVDFFAYDDDKEGVVVEKYGLLPVQRLKWLIDEAPDAVDGWMSGAGQDYVEDIKYFDYSVNQDPVYMRNEYLPSTLLISNEINSGFYLLNPNIKFSDDEWEAWYFSWKLPGALRFKSFAHLMRYAYYRFNENPDGDGIYSEERLAKTCANLLPVKEE